ncbi:5,10-methylenetetrahydrofolate reductase [hydrothermal vent metagenome]|uniref:methylenetetrahydrofolate reductase (NADH) n=1 Tax=hydrothermal vent metagenome TaxID=652676 RepID=A0A3B1BW44_9ZZZZ
MQIKDRIAKEKGFVSLEFFPPKEKEAWPSFFSEVEKLKRINPLFVSVTYGAGGGTQAGTLDIVTRLKKEHGLEPMAHLTCVGASEKSLHGFLSSLEKAGILNILALGGDKPQNAGDSFVENEKFKYASDLVGFMRKHYADFGVGVAAYPEKHPTAVSAEDDLGRLKNKLDIGGDFAVTQLFFDNELYFDFVKRAKKIGIEKPVIPGVMPILSLKRIKRIISMCGASIPAGLMAKLNEADKKGGDSAVEKVGIEHAIAQARDLLDNGAPGVHLYTLNKADLCLSLYDGLMS